MKDAKRRGEIIHSVSFNALMMEWLFFSVSRGHEG